MIRKLTMFLISKQPAIKQEFIKNYLDKKVVKIEVGKGMILTDCVLYQSNIYNSTITEGVLVLGDNNVVSGCMIGEIPQQLKLDLDGEPT